MDNQRWLGIHIWMASPRLYELIHELDLPEAAWVQALFDEGRELFDEGQGLFVYSYRVGTHPALSLGALAGAHTAPAVWHTLERWGSEHASVLAPAYASGAGSLAALSPALQPPVRELRARFESVAIRDLLLVIAHEPGGHGLFFTAPRASGVRLHTRASRSLSRLAAELGAGLRLREARRRADDQRLSASERRVLRLVANGAADKEIARALGVGLSTVSTFARRARSKLGCAAGAEALLAAAPGSEQRRRQLFARLSPAECDVAAHLLLGRSHAEIARRRRSSPRTIAAQCSQIFRKCGVAGQRALAAAMLGEAPLSGK